MRYLMGFIFRVLAGLVLLVMGIISAWHGNHDMGVMQLSICGLCWDSATWYYDKYL